MPTEMPGRATITAWAQFLGVDIAGHLAKADMMLAPDPDAMRAGSEQLAGIMESLQTSDKNAAQAGGNLLNGWNGASADTFGPRIAELGQNTAQTTQSLDGVRQNLTSVANDCSARINAVCNASAITAAFLGTQQAAAAPSATPTM